MAEKETNSCLADSSGSDGSLSKDLTKRAELNFSTPSVALEDEQLDKGGDLEVVEENTPGGTMVGDENKIITPEYDLQSTENIDKLLDSEVDALMVCEKCHGPITKMKRYGNSGKQFCSKQCAQNDQRAQALTSHDDYDGSSTMEEQSVQPTEGMMICSDSNGNDLSRTGVEAKETTETENQNTTPFNWKEYQQTLHRAAAPHSCFTKLSKPVKGLKPGMKLEALDKNNPSNYCVATVIDVVGHRVRIRYDGFGDDDSQDFWCNFQAEELYPIGWCAENSFPLQPPNGISSSLEDWKIFLTKTLTGALAAPIDLFRENENRTQAKVHCFQASLKVEVIHPKRPSIICPATITKSLGPYLYQVTTEPLPNLPSYTFYGRSESTGIFSFGWSARYGIDLSLPTYVEGSGLSKEKYLAMCRKKSAPPTNSESKKVKNLFKVGEKLAAVDLEEPHLIRVATVFNTIGRILLLLFDGPGKFQYMDCDSGDIYPIDWCLNTGHPLCTPHGIVYASKAELTEAELTIDESGNRCVTLPSFHTVLGKQLPHVKEELNKKLKARADITAAPPTSIEGNSSATQEVQDKPQEDPERHDIYSVYFNKSCVMGPYLDREKVAKMPDSTAAARPPAALRLALERIIAVANDPMETMDAMQDGFCAKLFSRGKSKVLKKGLCRFDTKVRASRLLKRLCKKLKSCEYFLSFDPSKDPCPLECKTSGTTSLESFITMRDMKMKDETQRREDYRKKRGRPRKEEFEFKQEMGHLKGEQSHGIDASKNTPTTHVRLLNLTSYNGRPLVPIAPGSKTPITIMPASSQVHHVRAPPPYDIGGHSSFVHPVHASTVITSATKSRMVTPVNVRMLPPSGQSPIAPGGDLSSPTLTAQNLATVLVVTKPPGTSHQGQGLLSLRGNVSNQGVRLPGSPNTRKGQIQVVSGNSRSKMQGTIKIHGPMFDQAPGTMNPMAASADNKQIIPSSPRLESGMKFLQRAHISSSQNKSNQNQMFENESNMISEFPIYRGSNSHNIDNLSSNQISRFANMKQPMDIKMEPQDHYHHSESSPVRQMSPTIHIHHPTSSVYHHISQENIQDSKQHLSDGMSMHAMEDDMEKSIRSRSSGSSPIKSNVSIKYDLVSHHGIKRHLHNQQMQSHMSRSLQSHMKNHLKVATINTGGSQSALSPLHSPPPLRPAPSGQHRSIALRSPPNLTPSTVISHFDFTPVTTTTSVASQSGRVIHHPNTQDMSKTYIDGNSGLSNGQIISREVDGMNSADILSSNVGTPTSNVTVTLTYLPVKTQPNDKIVYVPVNNNFNKERQQQSLFICSKPGKPAHSFQEQLPGGRQQLVKQRAREMKVPISSLEEIGHPPFSGITRKFTVRTLQRDSASISSALTTVRIQGSKLNEIEPSGAQNFQELAYYSQKDNSGATLSENTPSIMTNSGEISPMRRTISSDVAQQQNLREPRLDNEVSFYNSNDISYGEISGEDDDDDDDDDDDGLEFEEFSDEAAESEIIAGDGSQIDHRQGFGGRGRKRGRKQFLTRRKGLASHQFKVKYKQALEQAKFMRERRPSFSSPVIQSRTPENIDVNSREASQQISREDTKSFDLDARTVVKTPSDCGAAAGCLPKTVGTKNQLLLTESELKKDQTRNVRNVESMNDGENRTGIGRIDARLNFGNEEFSALQRRDYSEKNSSTHILDDKVKSEINNLKRRRSENDFILEQWSMSQDSQVKKKKRLNTSSGSLTKYLSDPLEKVKLPRNPEVWSEEDVVNFMNATECSEYADALKDQEIDGSALLLLTRESLMEFVGMKLGPALKICGYVATLKGRLRMQQNMALIQS